MKQLVIVVPGFHGRYSKWEPLCRRLQQEPGFGPAETVWVGFDHKIGVRSVGTLESTARKLCARVQAEWIKAGGFDEIVMVGHSMGGLLVRQAFLIAVGATGSDDPADWGASVRRIVLLASLNRGIDTDRKIDQRFLARLIPWVYRLFPFLPHPTVLDALKGSSFLANLRINWIRLFLSNEATRRALPRGIPVVVQVLGDTDNLVWRDDSKDVLAFPHGHYLEVPNSDHASLYLLEAAPDPELRYAVLRKAFLGSFPPVTKPRTAAPEIRRVIFLLHGIRASNVDNWIRELEARLKKYDPVHTEVIHPTYGYFTALRFALPSVRKRNIATFQDWYTEALALYPDAEFNIIAHSNGTYMLGQALAGIPGMRFKNVVLAGSVLPEDFWSRSPGIARQIIRVRNDRADRDWPVALLCNAMRGLHMRDVGTGGFSGFWGATTTEVAYYPGGHGEALIPENQDYLVEYVFDQPARWRPDLPGSPGYFRQLSNLMPYAAVAVTAALVAAIVLMIFQNGVFHLMRAVVTVVCLLVIYVVLDVV